MNKNTKKWVIVLVLLALIFYFWWRGRGIEKSLMDSVSTNTPPNPFLRDPLTDTQEAIADQNAQTDYLDNPTLLCCGNTGQMVSLANPNATSCEGAGFSSPVNGVCGGGGFSHGQTTNTTWSTTQTLTT